MSRNTLVIVDSDMFGTYVPNENDYSIGFRGVPCWEAGFPRKAYHDRVNRWGLSSKISNEGQLV